MTEEKLILDNIKLIYVVLKNYNLLKFQDEYFDICVFGLINGAKHYDENKGWKVSSYLTKCIAAELSKYLKKQSIPKRNGGVKDISIYTPINNNGEEEIYLLDTIPSNENIEEKMEQAEKSELMYKELSKLKERNQFIICSSYELLGYEKLTQMEIAKKLKISQGHVSKIIRDFIKEVRRKYD